MFVVLNALSNEKSYSHYDFKVAVAYSVSRLYVNNVLMIHFHLLDIYMYNKGLLTRILVHVLCIVCVSDFL